MAATEDEPLVADAETGLPSAVVGVRRRRVFPSARAQLLLVAIATSSLLLWWCAAGRSSAALAASGAWDVRSIVRKDDPLANAAAGAPGMPDGQDDDNSYLDTAPAPALAPRTPAPTPAPPHKVEPPPVLAPSTCSSNEELVGGLCYMKCSLLTNGTLPYRMSAYQCCADDSFFTCLLKGGNSSALRFNVPGSGFDQDGTGMVPHLPGRCLLNEENFVNTCYIKCSILTNGEYPLRSASNTCCKQDPCWNIFNLKSSGIGCSGYGIGGGDKNSSSCPHDPW